MSVIVIEFITLDGIVSDPDGSAGTPYGGWAFRHGPATVAGDKFQLGPLMSSATMLLGRRTWQLFAGLWPPRTDPFSQAMNTIPKVVASRSLTDVSSWSHSRLLDGPLLDEVRASSSDLIVTGSLSIVRALQEADLVDEYRLLTFPTALGSGTPLFTAPTHLQCESTSPAGAAVLTRYVR